MASEKQIDAVKASWILLFATIFWGFSFLAMKAVGLIQLELLPNGNTWFFSALSLVVRFGISTVLLLLWSLRTFHGVTRLEFQQGIGLGLVGGIGLLFQMDAVNYTSASTAAFLTQCYCLFIPVFVACRKRCLPKKMVAVSCVMVVVGVALLSKMNWREMRLGRGEWEAIVASVFFTAQILWLERPKFSGNNINHVTVIMFVVNLLSVLPVFFFVKPSWSEIATVCNSTTVILLYGILTIFCTLAAYTLMNYWQPHIDATRAGLIYCAEPLFASLFALFVPQMLSAFANINYPNEKLTTHLLLGGGLITAANVFILLEAAWSAPKAKSNSTASGKTFSVMLVFCVFGASTVFGEENWPEFRGPTGQGHSDSKAVPLHWSETENVKWKTAIPGQGWSSPVIFAGQIWMTTASENGKSLRAICVDQKTGKILQNIEVFSIAAPEFKHELNSYASPTPVVERERVFVHFGTYGTAGLSTKTGKILWRNQEIKLKHENGPGSSPILLRDKLIISCDGMDVRYLIALNKNTGQTLWKTSRSGDIEKAPPFRKAYSTPLVIRVEGREQVVTSAADYVFAYEPDSGKEIWRAHYEGYSNVPRPVYGDGLLFICTGFDKAQLWAIRPGGTGDVTQTHVAWKYLKQVPLKPSPILTAGKLFFISDNGIATCLDAKTGKELWQERLGGEHSASPVYVAGRIYFFSQDGATVALEPSEYFKPIATNQLGIGFMASPAISGNAFYLRSKTDLYRLEK